MPDSNSLFASCFIPFKGVVDGIPLPERFTFPFYYEPHELSKIAAKELQEYLKSLKDLDHNFGLEEGKDGLVIGKMFGVLVVRNSEDKLGYLAAFSGKLAGSNHHERFVPPVFDILAEDGFFRKEEDVLNALNKEIEQLESASDYLEAKDNLLLEQLRFNQENSEQRFYLKQDKKIRDQLRKTRVNELSVEDFEQLKEELKERSLKQQYKYKLFLQKGLESLDVFKLEVAKFENRIIALKEERKMRSSQLQQRLFENYSFLNLRGNRKNLLDIFKNILDGKPPAGAGECAAPKLLQYAFLNDLDPIALAEFWWGASPKSEIRQHKLFYPACRGKCEPILGHMLMGMKVDSNPMLENPAENKDLPIVFEDEYLVIVNKPAEFLSVPGKTITDSVYARVMQWYPEATGPLIVHRLDMSTSGLMVLAKSSEVYVHLQRQFTKRYVKKRYTALLDGLVDDQEGSIDLPLRVDLDDRPRQMVCFEHGKNALTKWKVVERTDGRTKIHFFPVTGRTHQLRVHSAHPMGLNSPIVGDDLYGKRENRLHLHAAYLEFTHPVSKELMVFEAREEF